MGRAYKITHISAVTFPRLLNLVPNRSLDTGLLSISTHINDLISIFININENKNCDARMGKYLPNP